MLKGIRNSMIATSVLYILLGGVLIFFSDSALKVACTLIGVVTLIYGILRILSYVRMSREEVGRFDLCIGVLLAALGLFLLISPQFIMSLVPFALGIYLVVDSVSAMKKAWDMKTLGFEKWWITFLIALALAVFGVVMVINPFGTLSTLTAFIGLGFLIDGVFTIANLILADRIYKT